MMEKQTLSEPTTAHRLHCIGCGAEIAGAEAAEDFRCRECGNLFEVEYPELLLRDSSRDGNSRTLPSKLQRWDGRLAIPPFANDAKDGAPRFRSCRSERSWKELWRGRRLSREPLDRSGVWRFRELLPFMADERHVVTLEEGNTPLYHLPRCGKSLGVEQFVCQAPGDESDRLL